jgi:1-acyl-sn-glycerol-3-phosphate acyltransferase
VEKPSLPESAARRSPPRRLWGALATLGRGATTLVLDLVFVKPVCIFIWWFSQRANAMHFRGRAELRASIERALAQGRPVFIALNHVSWFDDPVLPIALYRTGQRAALEAVLLAAVVGLCVWLSPSVLAPPPAALGIACALLAVARSPARKVWWTLGDLVNLSDAKVLRGKLALTRSRPPGLLQRALVAVANVAIPWLMRTGSVRTVFIDRRSNEQARHTNARAVEQTLDVAERLEPVWVFFEGGRTRTPGVIAPARRGVGSLILGARERGQRPWVGVVYHSGMERLIPPGGRQFLSTGHELEVRWTEFDVEGSKEVGEGDAQAVADAIRAEAVGLQGAERAGRQARA